MKNMCLWVAMIAALVSLVGCLGIETPNALNDGDPSPIGSEDGDGTTIVPAENEPALETPDDDAENGDDDSEADEAEEEIIDRCANVVCTAMSQCHSVGVCDPETGSCSNPPKESGEACDDGDACTVGDHCDGEGNCIADPMVCTDDGNPCTDEECVEGFCLHPNNRSACNDGSLCTVGDACKDGFCNPGPPKVCNDDNQLTLDYCTPDGNCHNDPNRECDFAEDCVNEVSQCVFGTCAASEHRCVWNPMDGASCDDSNACTVNDRCNGTQCERGQARDCDDNNVCTTDSCDPASGCLHPFNLNPCDDHNACTTGDTCSEGSCQPGTTPLNCDDGNLCTTDACDPVLGCTHDALVCPSDNPCSGSECNPATGLCGATNVLADGQQCSFLPDGWPADMNCRCKGGQAIDCGAIWECIDDDGDGRCNDGNQSCVDGDHKCRDRNDTNCDDNCPGNYNTQQLPDDCPQ